MRQAVQKNSLLLALFAIVCTALVGVVDLLTSERIEQQKQQELLRVLHNIIDEDKINNDPAQDCVLVNSPELGGTEDHKVYLARNNQTPIAAALSVIAPDGYSGKIELIVAVNYDGTISGVRTLKHQETPGLGDKIEEKKDDWIDSFTGKKIDGDVDSRWAVIKDGGMFEQFTGATITPRAVVKAVKKATSYFNKNKEQLFTSTNSCRGNQ